MLLRLRRALVLMLFGTVAFPLVACGGGGGGAAAPATPPGPVGSPRLRAWGTAELVEAINTGEARKPHISMDLAGNAVAVWTQTFNSSGMARFNRFTVGSGWGGSFLADFNSGAGSPRIAVAPSGDAMAIWSRSDPDGIRPVAMVSSTYTQGDNFFTIAEEIDASDIGDAFFGAIAADASGNAVAVWLQDYGSGRELLVSRYIAGSGWAQAFFVGSGATVASVDPQIAVNAAGDVVVAWIKKGDPSNPRETLWASRAPAGDYYFQPAAQIDPNATASARGPALAIDPAGNALLVWEQGLLGTSRIWASRQESTGGWSFPAIIESNFGGNATTPDVAVDAAGRGVAVWCHAQDNLGHIWSNRYTPGGDWGAAELRRTGTQPGNLVCFPRIAMNAEGKAIVVAMAHDGTGYGIWANDYLPVDDWGAGQMIETNIDSQALYPQVVIDAAGRGLAIWEEEARGAGPPDPGGTSIWSNRFE